MGYIKSHSNYVIQKKHQDVSNGDIFERDITTIGGLNNFAKGQVPIYNSSNFIITVRNDNTSDKDYTNHLWIRNKNSDVWTLDDTRLDPSITLENTPIFKEYYTFNDFSYYGSCSELIRASLTDIINRFPGELYAPIVDTEKQIGIPMYYIVKDKDGEHEKRLYGDDWYLLDNPFHINIHAVDDNINKSQDVDVLKYFCQNGYKEYQYFDDGSDEGVDVEWDVTITNNCENNSSSAIGVGEVAAQLTINGKEVVAVMGNNNQIVYLTNSLGWRVRPKIEHQNEFFNSLDSFQKVILNKQSQPIYTAVFEVIKENEFGYYKSMQRFTFPTTYGGYNLAIQESSYAAYLTELVNIATYYDTVFCDNLYRNMTHEAIKNYDWSYERSVNDDITQDYIFGGSRIQKLIRLFGRELDEIKYYIDGIGNSNSLSYNNDSDIANNNVSNMLTNDGWDVLDVTPFVKIMDETNQSSKFVRNNNLIVSPFYTENNGVCFKDGYFVHFDIFDADKCLWNASYVDAKGKSYDVYNNKLTVKVIQYFSDKKYTVDVVNKTFQKILRLNSRNLLRSKGTVNGMEMMLSLFGLRSKQWYEKKKINETTQRIFNPYYLGKCDNTSNYTYDYDIVEYVSFAQPIIDEKISDDVNSSYEIDWYNQTKTIAYDTDNYRNGIYEEYQGLPLIYYDVDETRYLVPYFNKDKIIDGNPYYQMYGGWLWKEIQYNSKDTIVESDFTETLKDIPLVNTIRDLLAVPYNKLSSKVVYYVKNLDTNIIIIDGIVYDIQKEYNGNNIYEYFSVYTHNGNVKVGQQVFTDAIIVSSPYGIYNDEIDTKEDVHYLLNYDENTEIRIYLMGDEKKCIARSTLVDEISFVQSSIFYDGKLLGADNDVEWSHYFQLIDRQFKNEIGNNKNGWVQLSADDDILKKIDNLVNYFNGNNPHSGEMKYDLGEEYLKYFKQIFKYAIENKEFDLRCFYGKSMDEVIALVSDFGFTTKDEVSVDKVNYFGNYLQVNEGAPISTHIYEDIIKKSDNTEGNAIYAYNIIQNQKWINAINDAEFISKLSTDNEDIGFTDLIVNTKRVDIIFNVDKEQDKAYIKYIDDVVLPYLSQMIPPNTIVKIKYEKNKEA